MAANMSSRTVLIVDDYKDSADSLASLLRMFGHEVHIAYDGLEALELAEEFQPDVVLLDITLPRLNGFSVVRRLRKSPWGVCTKVIGVSGWSDSKTITSAKRAGFDAYRVKPIQPDELLHLIAN